MRDDQQELGDAVAGELLRPAILSRNLMATLESSPRIRRLQPTAGTTMTLDAVRLTVMGPGVGLRNRFDTYGIEINDSSITIMVEYPASPLFAQQAGSRLDRRAAPKPSRRLLLGGDAQFTSWAQTTVDFPDLQQTQNATLAKELRSARGKDYLTADLIKISHHAVQAWSSKDARGIRNLGRCAEQ